MRGKRKWKENDKDRENTWTDGGEKKNKQTKKKKTPLDY